MKLQLTAILISVTCMTASALEPGRYLISTHVVGTEPFSKIEGCQAYRGFLLTIPKEGLPRLEAATSNMQASYKIGKIESVRITDGVYEECFILEAKFTETDSSASGHQSSTFLLNLGISAYTAAGSEINLTNSNTVFLRAHIGRLGGTESQDSAPKDNTPR